jgi:hypothetical protein
MSCDAMLVAMTLHVAVWVTIIGVSFVRESLAYRRYWLAEEARRRRFSVTRQ